MSTFAYDFDSQVLSGVAGINPVPLTYSLSGPASPPSNGVISNTVILSTCGTLSGRQVYGIAFNGLTSLNYTAVSSVGTSYFTSCPTLSTNPLTATGVPKYGIVSPTIYAQLTTCNQGLTSTSIFTNTFTVNLSVESGTTFSVNRDHDGATFAILYTDGTFSYFTVNSALTAAGQAGVTEGGTNISFPEQRRLWLLEI